MEEILAYIKAKERKGEPSFIEDMIIKFKDKDIDKIIKNLLGEGKIYSPIKGILRDLG